MPEHEPHTDYLEKLGYDPRDVSLPNLAKWFVGLFAFIVVAGLIAYGTYCVFAVDNPGKPNSVFANNPTAVPEPRLQSTPERDMRAFRQSEDHAIASYGWVDRKAGIVSIPVDRAMELTLERGLPTRPATPQPERGPKR